MRAAVVSNDPTREALSVADWPDPTPPEGWVLVRLKRAALNRLDDMMLQDRAGLPGPSIFGSDGAGVVAGLGVGVREVQLGDEVLISPSLFWGAQLEAPGEQYEILGSPTHGTHAEMVVVPAENLVPKPSRLTWDEAAALPLAGVTAWRALVTRGRLRAGETVIVAAASSGVGTFAIQVAAALGAKVVAVSSSEEKLELSRSIGAGATVLRTDPDFARNLADATAGGADLALDPTGAMWQPLLQAVRPGGRLVAVGKLAAENATVRVQTIYWKQVDILGSSTGSPLDFSAFLEHVQQSSWTAVIDSVVPLEKIHAAYERLDAPDRVGKVVIDTCGVA
ncbi:MAG: zinc-binding dehydrogenase [Nocardioidaceae bacterium]